VTRWDVAVVGLGAMGSAAAWTLAGRGRRVLGLEQFEQGHDLGGSHGRSRIFRVAYEQDDYVRLAVASLPQWRALEEQAGAQILECYGAIDYGNDVVLGAIAAAMARNNVPVQMLDAADASRRWEGFRFPGPVLYSADGGRTDADTARLALQNAAVARGADLRYSTAVHSVAVRDDGVVLRTDMGDVEADVAVVTVNAWLPTLLSGVVDVPPIRITQEQPAFFDVADAAIEWPSFIHYAGEHQIAADFAAYGLPSPAEGGVKVGEHGTGVVVDPDAPRPPPESERLERLTAYVAEHLPGLLPEPTAVSRCLYDMTADEDFIVDRVGRVVIGGGFSGHGFKFVPEIGRLLADLADGLGHDFARFKLHRA
jgi:sarcosine oxidase